MPYYTRIFLGIICNCIWICREKWPFWKREIFIGTIRTSKWNRWNLRAVSILSTRRQSSSGRGLMILIVMGIGVYLTRAFWPFIKNVKEGKIFTLGNIALLKRIAYILLGLWIFTILYMRIACYYISNRLEFEHVRITDEFSNYKWLLFSALFLWEMAHIFMTGARLQEEKD